MGDELNISHVDNFIHYKPGSPVAFTVEGYSSPDAVRGPKAPEVKTDRNQTKITPWAKWGDNNLFPEEVMEDLRESTVGKRILADRTKLHYGSGLIYYYTPITSSASVTDDSGERSRVTTLEKIPLYIPEIEDFLEENNVPLVQKAIIEDLETFYNSMPLFLQRRDGKQKIAGLSYKKMIHCRIGRMGETTRRSDKVYHSYQWPMPNDKQYQTIDIFDADNPFRFKSFVTPLRYSTPDSNIYYELAIWDAVRQNGWMEIDKMVPAIKKFIFTNQAILKYHIKIPKTYWEGKFGLETWAKMEAKEKTAAINAEMIKMENFLKDNTKSGGTLITSYDVDKLTGKEIAGVIIEPIDNKFKDGMFNPDAGAAYAAILFAMGYDPTLLGANMVDKRNSGGSGSDKRESRDNLQSSMPIDRYVTQATMRLVTKLNAWNKTYSKEIEGSRIQWGYVDADHSQTLDENPTGKKNVLR